MLADNLKPALHEDIATLMQCGSRGITRPPDLVTKSLLTDRESLDFELLSLLEAEPHLSQREISVKLGVSLGKANYCLKSLADKGAIKLENFRASPNKLGYVYALTPDGISRRVNLMRRFLERKVAEYERLKAQIASLERDLARRDGRAGE